MAETYDVIVIGVGTMGAAACYHLSLRGARVLGLDQFGLPHALGAHHGHSRMIRLSYFEHSDYVPLLRRSYALWSNLEQAAGQSILLRTGGVYLSPHDGVVVPGCLQAAREHNLDYEILDAKSIRQRFPVFNIDDSYRAFYEAGAGVLRVDPAMTAHIDLSLRQGARIHGCEKVLRYHSGAQSVEVVTDRQTYSAGHLVIAGGAWSQSFLEGIGRSLSVTRQTQFWLWPKEPAAFESSRQPAWFVEYESGRGFYGFPLVPGQPGIKLASHVPGSLTTPETMDRVCSEGDWEQLRPKIRRFMPQADGDTLSRQTCLYTNSPDGHFMLGPLEDDARVCLAAGFSGHGFKFAPVIGECLAQLTLDGQSVHPIEFLSPRRFC